MYVLVLMFCGTVVITGWVKLIPVAGVIGRAPVAGVFIRAWSPFLCLLVLYLGDKVDMAKQKRKRKGEDSRNNSRLLIIRRLQFRCRQAMAGKAL